MTTVAATTSDVVRKGHGATAPQTAVLPPKQIRLKNFRLHLRLMYPQNVTIGGTNRSFVLYPHFHSSGTVSDCDG